MTAFDLTGLIALAIGAIITLLDGVARYNTRDRLATRNAEAVDIPPRYFTSERGYVASVLLYLAIMEVIFLGPAIAVPRAPLDLWLSSTPLGEEAQEQLQTLAGADVFPLIWSLLLVGALRYLPWINNIEPAIRSLCHNIAEIPHYVHELSRTLYAVDVNVAVAFPQGYRDDLLLVTEDDFNAPPSAEEHAWARLSYVMRELEEMHTELGTLPTVHFGARFAEEYENAASEFRSLTFRMARFLEERKEGAASPGRLGVDHRFKGDLRRAFARAALLFVLLLNLRYRSEEQISARLQALGFNTRIDPRRAESGPDAAVTVLALAITLFIACPIVVAGVDLLMSEIIGTGIVRGSHAARFADVITYPSTVLRTETADLATRVLVMFVLSFVNLLVLALVNLTIARRFGGIDPREMFSGDWLRRPYDKYFRAAALSAVLCLGTGMALMYLLLMAGLGDAMPATFEPVLMLIWLVPMFFIALPLHVFAQNRGHSLAQVLGEGIVSGVIWASVSGVAGFFFFTALGNVEGQPISRPEALGAALYYACIGFFVGTPFMAALLFVSKSARTIAARPSAPVLVVDREQAAAA